MAGGWQNLDFYLQPPALSYLRTKKLWTKVGSVVYKVNETELSFLESVDKIDLQSDAGVVFLQFLSRDTLFCFLFTFGVRNIAD